MELTACADARLGQEVVRLGGHYAHVFDVAIETRHDGSSGEAWLHGRFTYMLYRSSHHRDVTRIAGSEPIRLDRR